MDRNFLLCDKQSKVMMFQQDMFSLRSEFTCVRHCYTWFVIFKTVQWNFGWNDGILNASWSSFKRDIKGITSLIALLNVMYSDSAVNKAISVWSLLCQYTGHPANKIINPVQDMTFSALSASAFDQPPAKLASTKHSMPRFLSRLKIIPLSCVPKRYLQIWLTARMWLSFGSLQKRAAWFTAIAYLGRLEFIKYVSIPTSWR